VEGFPIEGRNTMNLNGNSGHYNSGHYNSGNCNSGDCNSGDCNYGDYNSRHYNSGDYNSGNFNSGDYNSGHFNSGHCNSGDYNSGFFNTDTPTVRCFNKETGIKRKDFNFPDMSEFKLTEWNGEKLITYDYKEAWSNFWNLISDERKEEFINLPNFDSEIFEEITGIKTKVQSIALEQKALKLEQEAEKLWRRAKELYRHD
jgi:hypothetical protein